MAKSRHVYASLQAYRGIAALMIVCAHVTKWAGGTPGLWVHPTLATNFRGMILGVDLFFVLSGIVILSAHWSDLGHPSHLPTYLWKRFSRIYPIYWIFLTITIIKHFLTPSDGLDYQRQPIVILSNYLLVHIHSVETNMIVGWTLFHEILFYAVFAILIVNRRVGLLVLISWLLAFIFFPTYPGIYWATMLSPLHLLFAFGMTAAWLLKKDRVPVPLLLAIAGGASFLTAICLVAIHHVATPSIEFLAGIGATLMLLGSVELERRGHFTVPRWLTFLGDASYSIYLAHFMIVSASAKLFFHLDQRLHLPILLWVALMASLAVSGGCIAYIAIEKPILRVLGRPAQPAMQLA